MGTKNVIILDEKQLIGGSVNRYLKYRFGPSVNILIVADMESCMKELNNKSQVIVLEYKVDDHYNTNRGAHIKDTIKAYNPNPDVILLSSDEDAREDIVKCVKKFEREAARHIRRSSKKPLTVIGSVIKSAVVYPVKTFADEHSVGQFAGLFLILFTIIGAAVFLVRVFVKL